MCTVYTAGWGSFVVGYWLCCGCCVFEGMCEYCGYIDVCFVCGVWDSWVRLTVFVVRWSGHVVGFG